MKGKGGYYKTGMGEEELKGEILVIMSFLKEEIDMIEGHLYYIEDHDEFGLCLSTPDRWDVVGSFEEIYKKIGRAEVLLSELKRTRLDPGFVNAETKKLYNFEDSLTALLKEFMRKCGYSVDVYPGVKQGTREIDVDYLRYEEII